MSDRSHWAAQIRHRFKLEPERYEAILASQGGVCAICKRPPAVRRLDVDHDRACCPSRNCCGRCVRGLLCRSCNAHKVGYYELWHHQIEAYLAAPPALLT